MDFAVAMRPWMRIVNVSHWWSRLVNSAVVRSLTSSCSDRCARNFWDGSGLALLQLFFVSHDFNDGVFPISVHRESSSIVWLLTWIERLFQSRGSGRTIKILHSVASRVTILGSSFAGQFYAQMHGPKHATSFWAYPTNFTVDSLGVGRQWKLNNSFQTHQL